MARIRQHDFFRPGTYQLGDVSHTFGAERIRQIVENTNAMIRDGIQIPAYGYHPEPGDKLAGPRRPGGQIDATAGVGWLSTLEVDQDGRLSHETEVGDETIQRKVRDGSIRHVSLETGRYKDPETGKQYGEVARHIAFTQKPRVARQGEMTIAMAHVDDDSGNCVIDCDAVAQMAEIPPVPTEPPAEPVDPAPAPPADPAPEGPCVVPSQCVAAARRLNMDFEGIGIVAPLTDPGRNFETWLAELGAVVRQFGRAKAELEAKEAEMVTPAEPLEEETPTVGQWGEAEWKAAADRTENDREKVAFLQMAEVSRQNEQYRQAYGRMALKAKIERAKLPERLTEALRDRLTLLQFAEDGSSPATFTVDEMIDLYCETVPESLRFTQLAEVTADDQGELEIVDQEDPQFAEATGPVGTSHNRVTDPVRARQVVDEFEKMTFSARRRA